jgi:hypothetical protein
LEEKQSYERNHDASKIAKQIFTIVGGGMILGWITWSSTCHMVNESRLARLETHIPYISQTVGEIKELVMNRLYYSESNPPLNGKPANSRKR